MPKKLLSNRQIKNFQKTSDNIRHTFGRQIEVYIGSGTDVAGSSGWDPVNQEFLDPNAPMVYSDTIYTIEKAIVRWVGENADYEFLSGGRIAPGDVFVKCKLEDVLMSGTDINNDTIFHHARKVVIDGQVCKVAKTPRKTGLRDLYSVEVWLKLVDSE
jgi:hypothetical protein